MTMTWLAALVCGVAIGATAVRAADAPASRPAEDLRVVSFNIRYDNPADGPNAWPVRRDRCLLAIRKLNPDLLGLQEVLARQQAVFAEQLSDYQSVAVHRDDGKQKGEAAPIFFRSARFDLLDHGVFWLSPTPDAVGSVGWDAALTRICTWVKLKDRSTGRELVVANAHFDHIGQVARTNSALLIMQRLTALAGSGPIVTMGDLNSDDQTPAYAEFVKPAAAGGPGWVDTYRQLHAPAADERTFHDFKGYTAGRRIDYVFVSPHLVPVFAGIDRDRDAGNLYPSDHYPVWCDLAWR